MPPREARRFRHELVPGIGERPALGGQCAEQRAQQRQRAGHLPTAEIPGAGTAPVVGGQAGAGSRDHFRHGAQLIRVEARFARGVLEGVLGVHVAQQLLEALERRAVFGAGRQEVRPVPPPAHEVAIVPALPDHPVGDRQEDGGFGAGVRGQPVVGVGRGVRQARVQHDQLGAVLLALHDALRVRVEVVPGFEVAADQDDDAGVGVVRARPVHSHPPVEASSGAARTDVRVRVVSVDAPGREHALGESVLTRAADVVHDLVVPVFLQRLADAGGNVVERLVPRHPLPLPFSTAAGALERMENPVGIRDLVERGRALGAVAAA